ncbi:MAG: acyltransferase family protein, partial [Deinococcus sp.]|nr:acyltransferase family protein [Deinococcus sp.]
GAAVAARHDEVPGWFRRYRLWLAGLTLAAVTAYLPLAAAAMSGQQVDSLRYSLAAWIFTTFSALLLYGLCLTWDGLKGRLGRVVAWLGMVSLQIYLIHPALLQLAERWWPPEGSGAERLLTVAVSGIVALLGSALFGHALLRLPFLSRLLFGR